MMTIRELSDAEQREAKVFAALDDWNRAEENYQVACRRVERSDKIALGFIAGLLFAAAALMIVGWCMGAFSKG